MRIRFRTQVWSCGGGTQSAAIAAMIVSGRIRKPQISVMVDTEREKETTWQYAHEVLLPELRRVGVDLRVVRKSEYEKVVDLYAQNGDLLLPVFTTQSGKLSKMPAFCSVEWKQRVVRRYLRSVGVKQCDLWLGISKDEIHRMRSADVKWLRHTFPLIDAGFTRKDCVDAVKALGWPDPPRSACWMCSNQSDEEWDGLTDDDWEKACSMDDELRKRDPNVFLHKSGVPLRVVELKVGVTGDQGECASGMCFL